MSEYAVTLSRAVGRQESDEAREPSDVQVLEAVGRGDDDALGVLYDRFGRPAYRLAFRILRDSALAEDAVQEAFLAVWRSADAYKRERAKPSTWILTVVHRRAVDIVRRAAGRWCRSVQCPQPMIDHTTLPVAVCSQPQLWLSWLTIRRPDPPNRVPSRSSGTECE